jgi:hypothetical protein
MSGPPVITHCSCPDDWLAQFSLTHVHKGGIKQHSIHFVILVLQLIESKGSETKFLDASNRFYTLIPHDFGVKKPPLLDTSEVIKVNY